MSVALGVEVGHWAVARSDMQRIADLAALAGVQGMASNDSLQQAANAAANVAELNGATGAATRKLGRDRARALRQSGGGEHRQRSAQQR